MNKGPQFRIVPPRNGVAWLINSFSLLRLQLARLLFISVVLQFMLTLTQLDLIGFLFVLAMPGLSAGMLEVLHRVSRGDRPATWCLFVPLASRTHTGRLLVLGGIIFIAGAASIMLMLGGNEGTLAPDILERIEQGDATALQFIDPALLQRMLLALALGVGVSATLSYFSIPLIWFRDMPLGAALKLGVTVLMANWKPFMMLGLALVAVGIPIVLVVGMLFSLGGGSFIALGVVLILLLGFQLMMFATQYCSYIDIFPGVQARFEVRDDGEGDGEGESGGAKDGADEDGADDDSEGDDDGQLIA